MRWCGSVAICLVWGLVGGCGKPATRATDDVNLDVALVKALNNVGVENAIISQHTLYPYHFVTGGGR